MLTSLLCSVLAASAPQAPRSVAPPCAAPQFAAPVRLRAGDRFVQVDEPGYAAPCWHDVDGDGAKDLVVGQFADGKIKVYRNLGGGKLAAGTWLEAGGKVAEVPGVW